MARPTAERLFEVMERLFAEIDQDEIRRDVEILRERNPAASREDLVAMVTRKAAMRTAAVGAAAAVATGPIGLLAMGPDIFNLVRQQSRLVLSIAFIYGHQPNLPERFKEVVGVLAVSTGTTFARRGMTQLLEHGFEKKLARKLVMRVTRKMIGRELPRVVPVIGGLIGGGLNYLAVRGVAKAAAAYYGPAEESS